MGMPSRIRIPGASASDLLERVFAEFERIDSIFSTYKTESEISRINRGEIPEAAWSDDMREIFALAEATKEETNGYFDIRTPEGVVDPSGLVKGWALARAARILHDAGVADFYIEIAGDIQTSGTDGGTPWSLGIRNPFAHSEIVKVVYPKGRGVATSGNYLRGAHIYNPHESTEAPASLASLTVVGPDIYEADRFATAAYAMGLDGLAFLEQREGFEAYGITAGGRAYFTSGFESLSCV